MRCTICSEPLCRLTWTCLDAHPDTCCPCATLNLHGGLDMREHHARRPTPLVVLSPREEEALAAFRAHMARLEDDHAPE